MDYGKHFNPHLIPQTHPLEGQVENSAGGYTWGLDEMRQLDRFLILGTEGGTYYITENKLTLHNAYAVLRALDNFGTKAVDRIVEISTSGRAAKNDAALFSLAVAAGHKLPLIRLTALANLPKVARTGTHLFTFLSYVQLFRGWGRALRAAVSDWYLQKDVEDLVYQAIKYRQRNGWTHADALRKAHPKTDDPRYNALFKWIVDGEYTKFDGDDRLVGYLAAQEVRTGAAAREVIERYRLPWEALPTEILRHVEVWDSLLDILPYTALLRNLGRMGNIGLFTWDNVERVVKRIADEATIARSRVHPIAVLAALMTYRSGRGVRGSLSWEPVGAIVDALDDAYYKSFGNVEPSGKRLELAVDVSGSMGWGDVSGIPGLTAREAAAAMAMVTVHVEPKHHISGFSYIYKPLSISRNMRIADVVSYMKNMPYGGTDCALPMINALKTGREIDTFVIYTDNETWAGPVHPAAALKEYRERMGINARLVTVGMCSNNFSIADPNDPLMLDVVGFDTATPQLITEFTKI